MSAFALLRWKLGIPLYDDFCLCHGHQLKPEDQAVIVAASPHADECDTEFADEGGELYLVRVGGAQEQFRPVDPPCQFRRVVRPK